MRMILRHLTRIKAKLKHIQEASPNQRVKEIIGEALVKIQQERDRVYNEMMRDAR